MWINFLGFAILFFLIEILYFSISKRVGITDKPNSRSSHQTITIRGGGIIFPLAYFIIFLIYPFKYEWIFTSSLLLIALISFVDDIINLNSTIRLIVQSVAVIGLLFAITDLKSSPWLVVVFMFILITGIINAYNFMDGINGITALYSLVTIGSLCYINNSLITLHSAVFYTAILASLLVFSFFNVRRKAVCFAGDVGSISIVFIICFLLFDLIVKTNWGYWILLLSIYGIDTGFTIFCRFLRKERLMQAHRSHFYQYLANEAKWSHIQVSALYAGIQLILNITVIYSYLNSNIFPVIISLVGILVIYTIFRLRLEGRYRLFTAY